MDTPESDGQTVNFEYLLWRCPGCAFGNRTDDPYAFLTPIACAQCGVCWQECPSENCYSDGPDCEVCGGQSGGLVRVIPEPVA